MVKFEKIICFLHLLGRDDFGEFQIAVEICSDNDPIFTLSLKDRNVVKTVW